MTEMIEVKTADLIAAPLNWAVAKIEHPHGVCYSRIGFVTVSGDGRCLRYSVDWSQGGPLIDKHMVSLHCPQSTDDVWAGWVITDSGEFCQAGDTALIAACRAIVAAKLGDTVQVPKALLS